MLNQRIALEDLEGVILDFGGVLYDIDYDAPPKAFARLGDSEFASLYHQASQSEWFDQLEVGTRHETPSTTTSRHVARRHDLGRGASAWCCILTGMPAARASLVEALGQGRGYFCSATPTPFTRRCSRQIYAPRFRTLRRFGGVRGGALQPRFGHEEASSGDLPSRVRTPWFEPVANAVFGRQHPTRGGRSSRRAARPSPRPFEGRPRGLDVAHGLDGLTQPGASALHPFKHRVQLVVALR